MKLFSKKKSKFESILSEAVVVTRELDAADTEARLSADAFFAMALKNGNTTKERVDALEEIINTRPGFEGTKGFILSVARLMEKCSRPFPDLSRLRNAGAEEAKPELASVGYNAMEAIPLAVRRLAKFRPENFGELEDIEAHDKNLENLRAKQAELFRKIGTEWGPEDIQISDIDKTGRAFVTFAASGREVALGPTENAGERLTRFLINHPAEGSEPEERDALS